MSCSQQSDSQVNNIDNLDWYSSFFQNDYMENNYIEELSLQENSNALNRKYDFDANQINSCKINSSIQQNIYTIQEESQENNQNLASKNNLSKFNTPQNKSLIDDVQNSNHNQQQNSNQNYNSDDADKNKDESQIKQSCNQSRLISDEKKSEEENVQQETDQQKQSSKQEDLIQEEALQKVSCVYQQPQQQQQLQELGHKQNEIELQFKKKSSSKRTQTYIKDLILDSFILVPNKVQKQKNSECQLGEIKKEVIVQKEENIQIKKQNLHQNLIQINQYFDRMKFNLQKSFTSQTDEKENCKLNQIKSNLNQQKPKIIIDNEKYQSSQLYKKNVCNQNLINQIIEQKKENIHKRELTQKNILSAGNKDLNIQFPELFFEKSQKNKQKKTSLEENDNYFTQINMKVHINQDQINQKTKSQTFKDKSNYNEYNISKNLSFDNKFNEKSKRSEISFIFQNELQSDQKCLQINNFDFRNKKMLKALNEFQEQFNSINYQLDSILQKSIEQKWEAQYLQEEKNNITKDIYDLAQIIKKLI
ncbi:hypothetical protein ABPG72_011550 [Tetrahymena utriculariae]